MVVIQMIYYILTTAFVVSIDSLVCGFSLALNTKKKSPIILGIVLIVFLMCFLVNYLTNFFSDKLNQRTASLGGIILICVGIYNLFKKKDIPKVESNIIKQSIITGVAVGFDGALANLSLALMGLNQIFVPIIIAVMHGIMIAIGINLSKTTLAKKIAKIEFMPPLILIVLGAYKLLGLFI